MGAKNISNSCARGKTNLKKKWLNLILILSIIISTLPYTTISNEGNEIEKDYHQPIEKLQWLSPNGE
ncbi:MAG: hypothetical protein U9R21_07540, partial [Candidatus Thermoplasmatota archaeon]|nr:hypothetical protein [Candidatus Thermoplasmatota archaeon]